MVDFQEMWEYEKENGDPAGIEAWKSEFIDVLLKEIKRLEARVELDRTIEPFRIGVEKDKKGGN